MSFPGAVATQFINPGMIIGTIFASIGGVAGIAILFIFIRKRKVIPRI
ncbi:MAG: hypothetical protein ACTSWY_14765 [Promethearchaeota archaeon]